MARLAGARLGLRPRDLDDEIAAAAGMPVADIFAREGEPAFRSQEAAALGTVAAQAGQVVATGGGIVVSPGNRALMRATGWVVCLEARPETLHARLADALSQARASGGDRRSVRPLLADALSPDPLERIRTLKASRQPFYAEAHWTIHTDALPPDLVAGEVARAVAILEGQAGNAEVDTPGGRGFPFGAKWFGRDRPLVCVPVVAPDCAAAAEQARATAGLAPDAIELRVDHLADLTPERGVDLLRQVAALGIPVIYTDRSPREGGARPTADRGEAARLAGIAAAIESGLPALVDLELATAAPERDRLLAARRRGVPVLLSCHDFDSTPDDATLLARLEAMEAAGADAAKLAVMPRDDGDALRLLAVCRAATDSRLAIPVVAIAMGPLGVITRVIGHGAGSALTFAAAASGQGSAPGQLTIEQLRGYWELTQSSASVGTASSA